MNTTERRKLIARITLSVIAAFWVAIAILAWLIFTTPRAHAVTPLSQPSAPPAFTFNAAEGDYAVAWRLSPPIQSYDVFNTLYLEGHYLKTNPIFDMAGMLYNSDSGGGVPVRATCFHTVNGTAYCTLYCPDKNKLFGIDADGALIVTDTDTDRSYVSNGKAVYVERK